MSKFIVELEFWADVEESQQRENLEYLLNEASRDYNYEVKVLKIEEVNDELL